MDISLNGSMLQFAAKFLDGKDADEARVKKLIAGIEGIYIRSFEFKKDGRVVAGRSGGRAEPVEGAGAGRAWWA